MKTTDYKVAHQELIKQKLKGSHYLERLPLKIAKRNKIIPFLCRCELRFENCKFVAYRTVHSRFGNKWTCDACAKELCIESDIFIHSNLNWRM